MAEQGLSIRPFLIKDPFQEVRQERGCDRRCQDMGACAPKISVTVSAIKPPSGGQQTQDVLISAPGHDLCGSFRSGVCMLGDCFCNPSIEFRGSDRDQSHAGGLLSSPWDHREWWRLELSAACRAFFPEARKRTGSAYQQSTMTRKAAQAPTALHPMSSITFCSTT